MGRRVSFTAINAGLFAAVLALSAGPSALADGGGGGGGGGSMSMGSGGGSSRVNPAEAYQRGIQLLEAREYKDAIRSLRTAQRALRDDPNVNYALGLAYVGDNDHEHAREPLERVVRAERAPVGAYLQLGLVYLQLNDRERAVAQQTTLQTMLTACDAACGDASRAQIQGALASLTQALEAQQPAAAPTTGWNFPTAPEGRAAYAEAVGLINMQHYAQALVALDRAEAAIGPHPDILNYKGFTTRRLGRTEEALGYYRQALALDPKHRGATEYLGELYLQMGRVDDARRQLARLDQLCAYGCAEREELAHWIETAQN